MINTVNKSNKYMSPVNYVYEYFNPKNNSSYSFNKNKDNKKYVDIINKLLHIPLSDDFTSFVANIVYEVPVEYCPNPNIAENFTRSMIVKIIGELIESNISFNSCKNSKKEILIYPSNPQNFYAQNIPIYQRLKYFLAQIKDYEKIIINYNDESTFDKLLTYLLLSFNKNIVIINEKARRHRINQNSPSLSHTIRFLNNHDTQNYEDFPF